VARTRLLLLAAGSACAALMLWGYIAPRYLGDFVPFLALASAVALADIFRRLEGRRRAIRISAIGVITVGAVFSILANVGMAVVPNEEMDTAQILSYVQTQKTVSDFTGHPLSGNVVRSNSLPKWGPAGQIYIAGNCNGMYISNGEKYWTVPSEQFTRTTWMAVEWGGSFERTFHVAMRNPGSGRNVSIPVVSAGRYVVTAHLTSADHGQKTGIMFTVQGAGPRAHGPTRVFKSGSTQTIAVITDPLKHLIQVNLNGRDVATTNPPHNLEPVHVAASSLVTEEATPAPTLCQSLIH
jgi:hypothetical protein